MRRAAVAVLAVAASAVPALAATTKRVAVGDYYFVRSTATSTPTVTVRRGTTVTWVWRGRVRHNVVVRSGPVHFRSRTMAHGTYSRRVVKPGLYRIVCTIHAGMEMRLHVS